MEDHVFQERYDGDRFEGCGLAFTALDADKAVDEPRIEDVYLLPHIPAPLRLGVFHQIC